MVRRFVFLLVCIQPLLSLANNLQFGFAHLQDNNITLSISWDNAWNIIDGSHDAVWVFVKGKLENGQWEHVQLSANSSDHYGSTPLSVVAADDGKGVFIKPIVQGSYSIPFTQLTVKPTSNLLPYSELKIYGIEMVYIPQQSFYLGDGASISSFANQQGNPFLVTSELAIPNGTIGLVNPNNYFEPPALSGNIPNDFPKGFKPFYIMKYELSQLQYADFLNTLSYSQQQNRTWRSPSLPVGSFVMVNPYQTDSLYRNAIAIQASGSENSIPAIYGLNYNGNENFNDESDAQHRAVNFLSWADLAAYLDWAALRPISEMEFEKACRGTAIPVAGEFSWGTPFATNANMVLFDGTVFESVSDVPSGESGIANFGTVVANEGWGLRGPLRSGFAASNLTNRLSSGASYYGVMELSGNVWEMFVAAHGDGLDFNADLGDGMLDLDGNANVSSWGNVQSASQMIYRGGGWGSIVSDVGGWRDLAVSDRYYSHIKPSVRRNSTGGRGGR
jgi:formylglycine-generating enzyme required for sulfatase activity